MPVLQVCCLSLHHTPGRRQGSTRSPPEPAALPAPGSAGAARLLSAPRWTAAPVLLCCLQCRQRRARAASEAGLPTGASAAVHLQPLWPADRVWHSISVDSDGSKLRSMNQNLLKSIVLRGAGLSPTCSRAAEPSSVAALGPCSANTGWLRVRPGGRGPSNCTSILLHHSSCCVDT